MNRLGTAKTFVMASFVMGLAAVALGDQAFDHSQRTKLYNALDTLGYPEIANGPFVNPKISHSRLLQRLKLVAESYKNAPQIQPCSGRPVDMGFLDADIALLEAMVAEDDVHSKLTSQQRSNRSFNDRMSDLIYELRNETAEPMVEPNYVTSRRVRNNPNPNLPTVQLIRIGAPAVPQLLEALNDTSYTRVVHESLVVSLNTSFESQIERVQDLALAILERISHQKFRASFYPEPYGGHIPQAVVEKAKAWWSDYARNHVASNP